MSKQITVALSEATTEQMRQFANDVLGISIHPGAKPETIRAKIAAAYDKPEITVTVPEATVERLKPAPKITDSDVVEEPWYTIIIAKTDDSGGDDPVPVSANGRNMWIERGKPQRIRHRYYHILENAVRSIYEQPEGPRGPLVERKVPAYPVTVKEAPSQAELDAWSKFKADQQAAEVAAKQRKAG